MKEIKTVQLFVNQNDKSRKLAQYVEQEFIQNGYQMVNEHPDLAVAIGGDGSFLRMVHENNFDTKCCYIGIHAGTLGFLQELTKDDVEEFIAHLNHRQCHKQLLDIQKTTVYGATQKEVFYSINEVVIRKQSLKAIRLAISINGNLLEQFAGDGILVSTSTGSTAYNMSFGGSLVDADLQTLQITPIAPLTNRHYNNLLNSFVIPDDKKIQLDLEPTDLLFTLDGRNVEVDAVTKVEIEIIPERISSVRYHDIDSTTKIREKLLKE
ncbi:MAG: NAD(+)/NADH kinase [Erysipelotrichaceae bacterium]|nr:NAD(+)/NADH kinase [Erysipelotrichaceae bacterium]